MSTTGLAGKVAVVTGATRGVGRMIAGGLLDTGMTVYIGSRDEAASAQAVAELSARGDARPLAGRLTDDDACRALAGIVASEHRSIHLLVNNAAVYVAEPIEQMDDRAWDEVFAVNVKAPFLLTRAFLPLLLSGATKDDPTRIINIGSISGLLVDGLPSYPYSTSKAALHHLTRLLAAELGPKRITVNAVAAGPFESDTMRAALARFGEQSPALPSPLRRIGRPEDICATVLYLAGPGGGYVTGAVIPVDGGISTTR